MMPLVGHPSVTLSTSERLSGHSHSRSRIDENLFETSKQLDEFQWEFIESPLVDQGPLFVSCAALNSVSRQLIFVSSMPKNRFCELVRFDMGSRRWLSSTRTRHFRPPKRIGSAAVIARGHVFIFGGYELSNQICNSGETGSPSAQPTLSSRRFEANGCSSALFAYPSWWIYNQAEPGDLYDNYRGLVEALGDFHGYDLNRGEWKVLVSRDQRSCYTAFSDGSIEQSQRFKTPFRSPAWKTVDRDYLGSTIDYGEKTAKERYGDGGFDDTETNVPCPRAFHTLVRHGSALLLFGGEKRIRLTSGKSSIEHLNDLWMFDLRELRWSLLCKSETHSEKSFLGAEGSCSSATAKSDDLRYLTVSTATSAESCFGTDKCGDEAAKREVPIESDDCGANDSVHRPLPRSGHSAVFYMDTLYIYGGQNSTSHMQFNDLWSFDIKNGRWRLEQTKGPSPGARCGHVAAVVGNGMCVYGGLTSQDVAERDPSTSLREVFPSSVTSKFSDGNAIYYLNFESLLWSKLPVRGPAPEESRCFGRQNCFFWAKSLWLGGPTGSCSTNIHQIARLDLSCLLNGSGTRKYQPGWDTGMGNELARTSFASLHDYRSNDCSWMERDSLKKLHQQDSKKDGVILNASTTSTITTFTSTTSSSAVPSRRSNFMNFLQDTAPNIGPCSTDRKPFKEGFSKPEASNLCCDLETQLDWQCHPAFQRLSTARSVLYSDSEFMPQEGFGRSGGSSTSNSTDCHSQFLLPSSLGDTQHPGKLETFREFKNPGACQHHQSLDFGSSNLLEGDLISGSNRPWSVSDNITGIRGWEYSTNVSAFPQLQFMKNNLSPRLKETSCSDQYCTWGLQKQPWTSFKGPEAQPVEAEEPLSVGSRKLLPVENPIKLNCRIPDLINPRLSKLTEYSPARDEFEDLPTAVPSNDKCLEPTSYMDSMSLKPEDLLLLNLEGTSESNYLLQQCLERGLPHAEGAGKKADETNTLQLSEFYGKDSAVGFSEIPTDSLYCHAMNSSSIRSSEGTFGECARQAKCSVTIDGATIQKIKQQVSSLHAEVERHREENSKLKSAIMLLIPHLKMEESGAVLGSQSSEFQQTVDEANIALLNTDQLPVGPSRARDETFELAQ